MTSHTKNRIHVFVGNPAINSTQNNTLSTGMIGPERHAKPAMPLRLLVPQHDHSK